MPLLNEIVFLPAKKSYARQISFLIQSYTKDKFLLFRREEEIEHSIDLFDIAVYQSSVVGCVSLFIYGDRLAEIRSLAVASAFQGLGIGKRLLKASIEKAISRNIKTIFALTLEVDFFKKNGFEIISKNSLPDKIWQDCIHCSAFYDCKETALILKHA